MSDKNSGYAEDLVNVLRGLCMGAADIVPGVSGGTMALILGHYQRLVTAIGNVNGEWFTMLREKRFADAARHLDLRFLVALALGIGTGVIALASLMHYLLEHQQSGTYAVFCGLILGSSYLVAKRLKRWKPSYLILVFVGGLAAFALCVQSPVQGNLTWWTAFLAATVAICAMILPGISGAFVLLLLGLYHPVTDLIKGLPRGEIDLSGLVILASFGVGCAVGLLSFTKLLKWLLRTYHDGTMALLLGLMLGSLYKIWPFQRVTEATAELRFKEQQFVLVAPETGADLAIAIVLMLVALSATLGLEKLGERFAPPEDTTV